MAEISNLYVRVGAEIADFKRKMNEVSSELQNRSRELKSLGGDLTLGLTAPIAAFGALTLRAAGNFEAGMKRVQAVSDATNDELEKLTTLAKDLGATTQFSATEAASGLEFLAMAGYSAAQQMEALPGVLNLAASSGLDLGRAADIATNVLSQFRLTADQTGKVVDVLAKTVTSSNSNMEQLADAMNYLGPTAAALGIDLTEAAAAVGILSNNGLQGSLGTRALGTSLVRLASPTKQAQKVISELGLEFFDASGNFVGLAGAVGQLQRAFRGLTQQQQQAALTDIFGAEAIQELNILISSGEDQLRTYSNTLQNSVGKAAQVAETRMQGFNGAMKEFTSALESVQIAIAESGLIQFATDFIKSGAEFLRGLNEMNPALFRFGTALAAMAAAIGPVMMGLGLMVSTTGALVGALGALAPPIGIAIAAFAGITAAIAAFSNVSEDITKSFEKQTGVVKNLETRLEPLVRRYEQLQPITNKTAEEQRELKDVIQKIGEIMPAAVTQFDQYGKAIAISAEQAKKLTENEKELLKLELARELRNKAEQLEKYTERLKEAQEELKDPGLYSYASENRKMNYTAGQEREIGLRKEIAALEANIEATEAHLRSLKGEKTQAEINAEAWETYAEAIGFNIQKKQEHTDTINEQTEGTTGKINGLIEKLKELDEAFGSAASETRIAEINKEIAVTRAELERLSELRPFRGITDGAPDTIEIPIKPVLDTATLGEQLADVLPKHIVPVELDTVTQKIKAARQEAIAMGQAFGDGFSVAQAEAAVLEQEILSLIAAGANATDPIIQGYIDRIKELNDPIKNMNDSMIALSTSMIDGFARASSSTESFGKVVAKVAKNTIRAFLAEALAAHIKNAIAAGAINPILGIALAAAGTGAIHGLFNALPKFGDGAYVTGPTTALIGEKGNEYVLPEAKLEKLVREVSGGGSRELVARVSGDDIEFVLQRSRYKRSRLN